LTTLDCSNCYVLIYIPGHRFYCNMSGCSWLHKNDGIIKLILIQRRIRQVLKYYRFARFIKSREFNEWFYAPEGIGGKMNKVILEKFVNYIY